MYLSPKRLGQKFTQGIIRVPEGDKGGLRKSSSAFPTAQMKILPLKRLPRVGTAPAVSTQFSPSLRDLFRNGSERIFEKKVTIHRE